MSQREWNMCKTCGGVGIVLEDTVVSDWEATPGQVQEVVDTLNGDGTVDFLTAMRAARDGKRVRMVGTEATGGSGWYRWADYRLVTDSGMGVSVASRYLDARWEIEQPPPREYNFLEAVEMMKAEGGKKMRPKSWKIRQYAIVDHDGSFMFFRDSDPHLSAADVLSPWVEVTA
jgi:hypothetical protein